MALPLELGGIQDPDVRRALEQIASRFPLHTQDLANDVLLLAVTGTQRKVAYGTSSATWTAAVTSANVTITHGLPGSPVFVGLTAYNGLVMFEIVSKAATTFVVAGTFTDAVARSGTNNFDWLAIG